MYLRGIADHGMQIRRDVGGNGNLLEKSFFGNLLNFRNQMLRIQRHALALDSARESQDLLHHFGRAGGAVLDVLHDLQHRFVAGSRFQE